MSSRKPTDHEIKVATNRLIFQSMVSPKAWEEIQSLEGEVREALESMLVDGLITETDGQYRITELGEKWESGQP